MERLPEELQRQGLNASIPLDVAKAVMSIRLAKLPDPDETPNVGSFFKILWFERQWQIV